MLKIQVKEEKNDIRSTKPAAQEKKRYLDCVERGGITRLKLNKCERKNPAYAWNQTLDLSIRSRALYPYATTTAIIVNSSQLLEVFIYLCFIITQLLNRL